MPPLENTAEEDELLTIRQVAKQLKVDDTTVRRWIKEGHLPAISLPHKPGAKRIAKRIRRSDVTAILTPRPTQQ